MPGVPPIAAGWGGFRCSPRRLPVTLLGPGQAGHDANFDYLYPNDRPSGKCPASKLSPGLIHGREVAGRASVGLTLVRRVDHTSPSASASAARTNATDTASPC